MRCEFAILFEMIEQENTEPLIIRRCLVKRADMMYEGVADSTKTKLVCGWEGLNERASPSS